MVSRSSKSLVVIAAALLAVSLAIGCGGGGDGDSGVESTGSAASSLESFGSQAKGAEARRAEAALSRYLDARAAEDWGRACSYLLKQTRRQLERIAASSEGIEGETCAAGLAALSGSLSSKQRAALAEAMPESVRVDGSEGFVFYVDGDGVRYAIRAEREQGNWRFSGSPSSLG